MPDIKDVSGQRFGKLVAIKFTGEYNSSKKRLWLCKCDCGNECKVTLNNLTSGKTKSCGCSKHETGLKRIIDLTGKRFGRLTVIDRADKLYGTTAWKCKCDCGNTKVVTSTDLREGKIKSCGCFQSDSAREKATKHNLSRSRIYITYNNMKGRCYRKGNTHYKIYGGRGIKICDEWLGKHGFENFCKWAFSHGYEDTLTIERIDVNGNYEPSNCKWIPLVDQASNRRNSIIISLNGEEKCLGQWCKQMGIGRDKVRSQLKKGFTPEQIFLGG